MAVTAQSHAGMVTITLDDGDKNVLTRDLFAALHDTLDRFPPGTPHTDKNGALAAAIGYDGKPVATAADGAEAAQAIVLAGRNGIFSAGLDLAVIRSSQAEASALLSDLASVLLRLWTDPRPTVCAATGHAIAGGTLLALACDVTITAPDADWGMLETQVDLEVPDFAIALCQASIRADYLDRLLLPGARINAASAVDVGFADELANADQVVATAQQRAAERLALPVRAYGRTKLRLRRRAAEQMWQGLSGDLATMTAHLA